MDRRGRHRTAGRVVAAWWWQRIARTSSGWGDLNSRPLVPQTSTLTKLRHSPLLRRAQSTKNAITRQPRYNASIAINSLKCHGVFSPLISESSRKVGAWVDPERGDGSISRPHSGQPPSFVIADGAKYREHGSHHGTCHPCSERVRTRSLIGVEPNSNASRMERSKYRRYVRGNSRFTNNVKVGGSTAPCRAYSTRAP